MSKKIISVIICSVLFLSVFCIIPFAADSEKTNIANGLSDFEIFNNLYYSIVPKGYPICNDTKKYSFFTEKNNDSLSVDFYVFKNEAKVSVSAVPETEENNFCESLLNKLYENEFGKYEAVSHEKTAVNGCSAFKINCKFDCFENEKATDIIYVTSSEEFIYAVRFESYYGFPISDIEKVLNSFSVSGTHFDGDKEINKKDFKNAPEIIETLKKDLAANDEYTFGKLKNSVPQSGDDVSENELWIAFSLVAGFSGIPFIVLTVLVIIFAVKYKKNKKELNKLKSLNNK